MEIKITEKKVIIIEPINARVLSLKFKNISPTELREYDTFLGSTFSTGKILGLSFYDKKKFIIGDVLKVNDIDYTINVIEPGPDFDYYLIDTEFNQSVKYLLPLISENNKKADGYLVSSCLYNTYLSLEKYPEYNDCNFLFLCYKFINDDNYKKLEKEIINQKNFVATLEPSTSFTIFVMELDKKYNETISLFLEGKHHNFKPEVKSKITEFYSVVSNKNYNRLLYWVKSVMNRDKLEVVKFEEKFGCKLPSNMSIESKPDINLETLKL